jgi:hypothetical protein
MKTSSDEKAEVPAKIISDKGQKRASRRERPGEEKRRRSVGVLRRTSKKGGLVHWILEKNRSIQPLGMKTAEHSSSRRENLFKIGYTDTDVTSGCHDEEEKVYQLAPSYPGKLPGRIKDGP